MNAVLFDMDGVLCDSEAVLAQAAITYFQRYGITAFPQDFHPFIGAGENRYIGGVAEKYGIQLDIEQAKREVYQIYLSLIPSKLQPFPNARELVQACQRKGWKTGLVSSADRVKIDGNLQAAGFSKRWFDVIISGEMVKTPKPAPDIYLVAAQKLGITPTNCCVIEDAIHGIESARAAKMKVIAVATTFSASQLTNADYVASSLSEVSIELIERILQGKRGPNTHK